ncbi:MAG: crotonase/enoyl-CoA hydratase family protein [Mycolicibacterium neoaurum]|uniref:crotonase/enoyl-CoA hydratase family protein n=1 Tax=Mycolicibacterium neoaurum TaxID=1795 RepID=UPI002FF92073
MSQPDPDPSYRHIGYSVADGVLTITLNRPERLNAFTELMATELIDAFDRADADDAIRAVMITGAGRGFCAGADLESGGDTFDFTGERDYRDTGGLVSLRVYESLKPVIAAINGPAVGVGISMTLPADVRLASESARFGFVFARRGIVLDAASSWFLPRTVGIARALEWTATARIFGAGEALDAGLVSSVHPADKLLPAAYAVATEIVANTAPVSVALNRQMLWRMLGADHPMTAHELDSWLGQSRGASADANEGVTAFLEKRTANFPDRVSTDLPAGYPWWKFRPFIPDQFG